MQIDLQELGCLILSNFLNIFEVGGSNEIDMEFEASDLDSFWNKGLSLKVYRYYKILLKKLII